MYSMQLRNVIRTSDKIMTLQSFLKSDTAISYKRKCMHLLYTAHTRLLLNKMFFEVLSHANLLEGKQASLVVLQLDTTSYIFIN